MSLGRLKKRGCGSHHGFVKRSRFFGDLFASQGARRIHAYVADANRASQRLCERLGMRREGLFLAFVSFVNNPDETPRGENTYQYAKRVARRSKAHLR